MRQITNYTHRFLARFIIEAKTPLSVGSGQKDVTTDALVTLDVNGLPYIPGTSLAGVVRSILDPMKEDRLFGYQPKEKDKAEPMGRGSEIIFTEGRILDSKGNVVDGLLSAETLENDPLLREYLKILPIRQHVCINGKGTAKDGGKFDQQVVYAGSRFCFELEIVSDGTNQNRLDEIIKAVCHRTFRLGGGTRKGYGEVEIVRIQTACLDLKSVSDDLNHYLEKSSLLSDNWPYWVEREYLGATEDESFDHYQLILYPDGFIMFGSGYGDAAGDANMTTTRVSKVVWEGNTNASLQSEYVVIPGSSVKGAIRHRVAYRYNQLAGRFVDGNPELEPQEAHENIAVRELFGYEDQETKTQMAGRVLISDVISSPLQKKLMNHVCIDRFTGGAIEGFLFTEQVDCASQEEFILDFFVEKVAFKTDFVKSAFESALKDVCSGRLPLGGSVNRGNGTFTGTIKLNDEIIYES